MNINENTNEDYKDMYAEERKIRILEMLAVDKKVAVAQLSGVFNVTGATIRTDLRDLELAGMLTRTHGGAIQSTKTGFESNMHQRKVEHQSEKRLIALTALSLVEDGDTIVLDAGTTTMELACCLIDKRSVTVVTNDILIAHVLEKSEKVQTILMGGVVRKGFHCTTHINANGPSGRLTVDKAFMAANSFSLLNGATTPDIQQAETKKTLIEMSAKTILLCDQSKIGKVSFAQFAQTSDIHILITDGMANIDLKHFEKIGVEVLLAH